MDHLYCRQSETEKDPWDALISDISDSICKGKDTRNTGLASSQSTSSEPKGVCTSGSPALSRSSELSTTAAFPASRCLPEPQLTCEALTNVEYAYVCVTCLSEFKSVAQLRFHRSSLCFSRELYIQREPGLTTNMPSIPEPLSFYHRSLAPQTCIKRDPFSGSGVVRLHSTTVSVDAMAALGLRPRYSHIAETSAASKKLHLSLPEPLGVFGSPARPLSILPAKPRTPSLISQLLRSPTGKSPKRCSTSFGFACDRSTDDSCSDDDAVRECRVQLVDVMKSSSFAELCGLFGGEKESDHVNASRKPSSALLNSSANFVTSTVSPRWLLGIDLSSPLGMRVTEALGLNRPPDGFGLRAATVGISSTTGSLSSRGSAADLQKLRERDVYYPVVYKRPKRQKHVHTYHFRSRRGKLLTGVPGNHHFTEAFSCDRKLSRHRVSVPRPPSLPNGIPVSGSGVDTHGTSTVVKSYVPCGAKPTLRKCSVRISKKERELADCVLHSISTLKYKDDDLEATPIAQPYFESQPYENGLPLSVQLSEEVYGELMVYRDVVRRTLLRDESLRASHTV